MLVFGNECPEKCLDAGEWIQWYHCIKCKWFKQIRRQRLWKWVEGETSILKQFTSNKKAYLFKFKTGKNVACKHWSKNDDMAVITFIVI